MIWNEIPQYICDEVLQYNEFNFIRYVEFIDEQIQKYNLNMTPDFQRGHVWTEEQQADYIKFLLKGGKTGRNFYFNRNEYRYVCVDGLQRTTAIQKFVNNELKVFGQYFTEFHFEIAHGDSRIPLYQLKITVYTNDLKTEKEILQWYIDMNAGGTPHTSEEIQRVKDMINELEAKEGCSIE